MPIIEVNNLTKEYQLGHLASLKETAINTIKRLTFQPIQKTEAFKALDDVTFHVNEGEVLGIIGHNGAGKSTLLKHLANISKPTKGNVIVRGSVAPLIEVGAGVNPELTGRENIFLNGAILGIPKKIIRQKLDEIIEFSELEQFIDTPVKRYSSGMTVKLGFSIATSMDADILIVDEVLSVGDLAFQRKCFERMEDLIRKRRSTVLVVSHNIRQIARICTRAILLDHGKISLDSNSEEVCNLFYEQQNSKIQKDQQKSITRFAKVESTGEIELISIDVLDRENNIIESINPCDPLTVRIRFRTTKKVNPVELIVGTHSVDFLYLSASSTVEYDANLNIEVGDHELEYTIPYFPLVAGVYCIRFSAYDINRRALFVGESLKTFKVIKNTNEVKEPGSKVLQLPAALSLNGKKI